MEYKRAMDLGRKLNHLFFKSKVLPIGIEHFLAMFPATILVPLTVNALTNSNVIDVSLVLLTSGLGTIVFLLCSRLKIPTYLGSSFAYIGLAVFLINTMTNADISPQLAYSYVGWSYVFGSIILVLLSLSLFICKAKNINIKGAINFFLPAALVGPAISLIGLELASSAVQDAGFTAASIAVTTSAIQLSALNSKIVALLTLAIIIIATITRRKFFKNSALFLGMVGGFILSILLSENNVSMAMFQAETIKLPIVSIPLLSLPPNLPQLLIAVIPVALVVFTENMMRVTVITRMTSSDKKEANFSDKTLENFKMSTLSHGIASFFASLMGSVPNTLYAENIAVMGAQSVDKTEDKRFEQEKDRFVKYLHSSFSCLPYFVAAGLAIVVSFSGHLQQLLLNIPIPVLGGMKLFLFGIIAAPGIQLLVDQRVDYKKISNQILTASVLIAGISGLTLSLGIVDLSGMSLGLVVGILVNILIKSFDYFGRLNDSVKIEEIFKSCAKEMPQNMQLLTVDGKVYSADITNIQELLSEKKSTISINDVPLSMKTIFNTIADSSEITFGFDDMKETIVQISQRNYVYYIWISIAHLPENDYSKFNRDHINENDNTVEEVERDNVRFVRIRMGENVPMRTIRKLLKSLIV